MEIYVVQKGDTIDLIAEKYGVTVNDLIINNGLKNADNLVPGQTIVIVYPGQTYTVLEGDTLNSIANDHGISVMQLLRNNPVLSDREYIYPGETLVISYDTTREITTNGYTYPFIKLDILKRTLPYLTFISIFNYSLAEKGEVIIYGDDTNVIQLAKDYGTVPLLMISSLSTIGVPNPGVANEIINNEEYQDNLIDNVLNIMKNAGYQGVNIILHYISEDNQDKYIRLITKVNSRIGSDGYLLFLTINPAIKQEDDKITYLDLDYKTLGQLCYRLTFLQYLFAVNTGPPSPVSSMALLRAFFDHVSSVASTENMSVGKPLIAFDWRLPYVPDTTIARSLSLNSAITLASDNEVVIQFDDVSQTPYFYYNQSYALELEEHVVWGIDARSLRSVDELLIDYNLIGSGIWNIMIYYQQLWTLTNTQFTIIKLNPEEI